MKLGRAPHTRWIAMRLAGTGSPVPLPAFNGKLHQLVRGVQDLSEGWSLRLVRSLRPRTLLHTDSRAHFVTFLDEHQPPLIREGAIVRPDAPGMGIELDEALAAQYRKEGEPFFE